MPNTRELAQIIDRETGDVNNLRDKKLADATAQQQSGSASTDSVVMKTTGGEYVEIARDSFVGAIKGVMDGLIKGNSYTTLGANDPIAAFNSNALGGITPANLASVLGVGKPGDELYVDLGLPSGTIWATRNIDTRNDNGFTKSVYTVDCMHFSWGNTDGHVDKYEFGTVQGSIYNGTPGAALTTDIPLGYDAASMNIGSPLRIPSSDDFSELLANCVYIDASGEEIPSSTTDKVITINNVRGVRFKSSINGRMIFFPFVCPMTHNWNPTERSWYIAASYGIHHYEIKEGTFHARSEINGRPAGCVIRPVWKP